MNIALIKLGCPKNDVDAEVMQYVLQKAGHRFVQEPGDAEAIIVNTCGFIRDAKQQSVNTILEMAQYKESGRCRMLIVSGCLSQRYSDELFESLPEVDLMVGVNDYERIDELLASVVEQNRLLQCSELAAEPFVPGRILQERRSYAYLKIAEGCSNRCAYCAIPAIRGPYRSRPEQDIITEAQWLRDQGVGEIILIAQDTTRYGMDLKGGESLAGLLRKLVALDGMPKLRLLYCYPELVTDELLELISSSDKIANYLDIPLQHIDDDILKRMNRRSNEADIRALIHKIRMQYPGIALRTTFIVGFPGETEEAFAKLLAFVQEARFDNMGAFVYSPEEGTPATKFKPKVPVKIARQRHHALMMAQQEISRERLAQWVGKTVPALVDEVAGDDTLICRTDAQAPDIDGVTTVTAVGQVEVGARLPVLITGSTEYDLRGVAQ